MKTTLLHDAHEALGARMTAFEDWEMPLQYEGILADHRELGDALWDRFAGKKDGTLWYYHSLAAAFRQLYPGPLADELARTVAGFAGED